VALQFGTVSYANKGSAACATNLLSGLRDGPIMNNLPCTVKGEHTLTIRIKDGKGIYVPNCDYCNIDISGTQLYIASPYEPQPNRLTDLKI
jgi:hypothetical protein